LVKLIILAFRFLGFLTLLPKNLGGPAGGMANMALTPLGGSANMALTRLGGSTLDAVRRLGGSTLNAVLFFFVINLCLNLSACFAQCAQLITNEMDGGADAAADAAISTGD